MSKKARRVQLHTMTKDDFEKWSTNLVKDYASDHVRAGNWPESEAIGKASQSIERLLPDGIHTKDHFLYQIIDVSGNQRVGWLWFAINVQAQNSGFIFDLEIDEAFRRQGYATNAMEALEVKAVELGIEKLQLNVFGHNEKARALYETLGYEATNILMVKKL